MERVREQLFKDASGITRNADELEVHYSTGTIVARIWRDHLRPRIWLLILASAAMALSATTTGAIPFLIQRTADDVFVAKTGHHLEPAEPEVAPDLADATTETPAE